MRERTPAICHSKHVTHTQQCTRTNTTQSNWRAVCGWCGGRLLWVVWVLSSFEFAQAKGLFTGCRQTSIILVYATWGISMYILYMHNSYGVYEHCCMQRVCVCFWMCGMCFSPNCVRLSINEGKYKQHTRLVSCGVNLNASMRNVYIFESVPLFNGFVFSARTGTRLRLQQPPLAHTTSVHIIFTELAIQSQLVCLCVYYMIQSVGNL